MRVKIVTTGESVSVFVPPSHCNTDHQIRNLITDTFYFCILLWFEYFSVRIYFDAGRESGCRDQALHILCKWCADWVIECCLMENCIVAPLSNLTWPNFWCEDTWLAFMYTLFKLFFFHINSMKTTNTKDQKSNLSAFLMCLFEAVFQTHLGVYYCLTKDSKTKSAPCHSFALRSEVYRLIVGTQTRE